MGKRSGKPAPSISTKELRADSHSLSHSNNLTGLMQYLRRPLHLSLSISLPSLFEENFICMTTPLLLVNVRSTLKFSPSPNSFFSSLSLSLSLASAALRAQHLSDLKQIIIRPKRNRTRYLPTSFLLTRESIDVLFIAIFKDGHPQSLLSLFSVFWNNFYNTSST